MTLSLHRMAGLWDRTLPRPLALSPNGGVEAYPRRNTSLLQHHIVPNQLLNVNDDDSEDDGRRSTAACIPVIHIPDEDIVHENGNSVAIGHSDLNEPLARQRPSSVMSTEGTSRSSSTSTSPVEESNSFCLCQSGPHIPRPRNAFILYRQHRHAAVVAQRPGRPNPEISKIIGEQWRQLPDKAKEEWKALAEEEKRRHSQQFPGYRYKPKRSSKLGRQPSVSGPSPASSEIPENCQKCGGKPMTTPHTPYTPTEPMAPGVAQMNNRMAAATQMVSPPHSARMRQYADMYGRPVAPPHDPRFQYPPVQQRVGTVVEGPEPKKRRFNGDAVYASSRPMYPEQNYQRSPHDRAVSDTMVTGQWHRPNMGPPARTGYPVQSQATRPPLPQPRHQRDASLTLPPLKTPLSLQGHVTLTSGPQSQKSGVEAMIMSIPVLNKVKILSQIAPPLAAPGPASPPREMRGAIIAVEGLDPTSVFNMTNSLAEHLEREGKFLVRIFGGPDPYATLASSNRASNGEGEHPSTADFLDSILQWHKVSKEMQDYITKKPKTDGGSPGDVVMHDASSSGRPEFVSNMNGNSIPRPKSPVSAVSPKTLTQTADLSLKSPPANAPKTGQQSEQNSPTKTSQPRSRIPASAIALTEAESDAQYRQGSGSVTPRPTTLQVQEQTTRGSTSSQQPSSANCIPIAIVPHYQLTTVDANSIAMPINDAYSPHSHWQWLATLWRGCIGPDISIIIKAGDTVEDEQHSAGGLRGTSQGFNPPPPNQPGLVSFGASTTTPPRQSVSQQQAPQPPPLQDVEVRLQHNRSIIVRASHSGRLRSDRESNECWDKAKRRVGFEVEEFLRR